MLTQDGPPPEALRYLSPARYVESDNIEVRMFVTSALGGLAPDASPRDKAVALFQAVRDGIRYDPYSFGVTEDAYRASRIAGAESAFCVPKAILLAACLRAVGIPAALGFADVRNHLNTPRLRELMGSDLFIWHGYVQLWLGAQSFKVTPAFNIELCTRFGVRPLVFDGTADALFHEYDDADRRHMEYVRDRGLFVDAPIETFLPAFRAEYPALVRLNRERLARDARGIDAGFAPTGAPA